jgi:hypothetical protein
MGFSDCDCPDTKASRHGRAVTFIIDCRLSRLWEVGNIRSPRVPALLNFP